MTHNLTTECAKNYCNCALTVQAIVEMLSCFSETQRSNQA